MKKLSHIITGLCVLMLLSVRATGQAEGTGSGENMLDSLDATAMDNATAIMEFSLLPHIVTAKVQFDSITGCTLHIYSYLKKGAKMKDPLNFLAVVESLFRQAARSNAINVSVAWEATDKGYDIRTYASVDAEGIFLQEALNAFTDSLNDRHSETLSAIVEPKKTNEKIIAALTTLQEKGRYANDSNAFSCHKCEKDLTITYQDLMEIFPRSKLIKHNPESSTYFQTAFEKAPLNGCYRIAHLLAQVNHESRGMQAKEENLDYKLTDLLGTFNTSSSAKIFFKQSFWSDKEYLKYVVTDIYEMVDATKSETGDYDATAYVTYKYKNSNTDTIRVPVSFTLNKGKGSYKKVSLTSTKRQENKERWVNQVYGRKDLGNGGPETGDGYKYRGRGAIQLTGKDNYKRVGERCNKLFGTSYNWVINPDIVATDIQANIYAAIGYILNAFSDLSVLDGDNVSAVTIKINSKQLGLSDRQSKFDALIQTKYKCNKK
jgi:predicted chitinase